MAEMRTLTLGGIKFDIVDDSAVSTNYQVLTEEQKAQARQNIGAASKEDLDKIECDVDLTGYATEQYVNERPTVRYTAQNLTDEQKKQARENIGAASAFDPTVYGLPVLHLTGDTTGMSKDNAVSLEYVYGERSGTATVKWQGSSSLSYPKKNYTINFDNAFEAAEGWGIQKKYCLKANYIDHSHARNIVSAKLWGEIVKTRKVTGGITGAVTAYNQNVSDKVIVANGEVTVKQAFAKQGSIFFEGQTFSAGTHTITFEVFNPYTAEDNGRFAVFACGVPGTDGTDYVTKNVNTVEAYNTWLTRSVTADFPVDNSMIGFVPYTFDNDDNANLTYGYIFRNIQVDGVPYDLEPTPNILSALINGGAVDGFPCVIILNGVFHGLYTFNIPKDGWMFGMNDAGLQQAILCADTQNAACGFKGLATLTDDFDLEYVSDEANADWVLTSLNTLIGAVMSSDGTDLDTTVATYLDWESAIDYFIFTVLMCGKDMVRKNYLLVTYDGVKWFFSAYDMDSTYGMHWDGKSFNSANGYPSFLNGYNHRVMELIYTYKKDELLARYEEIRNTAMSEDNVYQKFTNFESAIPTPVLVEDVKVWPTIPSSATSNIAQILNWYRLRSMFIDKEAESIT